MNRKTFLVNATQHKQSPSLWEKINISFHDGEFRPYAEIDPNRGINRQCTEAWRKLLSHVDAIQEKDEPIDGFLIGGYAPMVLAIYQFLAGMRQRCFVAVMDEAPIKDGERRQFVLGGARMVPTPRSLRHKAPQAGLPIQEMDDMALSSRQSLEMINPNEIRHSQLVHVSARPLDDSRVQALSNICPQKLIGSAPILPPPSGSDMEDFMFKVASVAELAHANKCGILFDAPPAESMLHLFSYLHATMLPFYFLKTEIREVGKPAVPVSVESIPRF